MKSEGSVDYHPQFVVEALDNTIGELRFAVGEDVVYVVLLVIFVALVLEWMIFYSLIFHVI